MSNDIETISAPVIAPAEPPTPQPPPIPKPRPFIEAWANYILKDDKTGNGLHHRVKDLGDGKVEVIRLINENIKVPMSTADFEKFYKKV